MKILAISGSLRKDSSNTKLVRAFAKLAPSGTTVEIADIGSLPLYDTDLEASFPAPAKALKDQIAAADAVILATPEYNRSVPGVLKNAVDWASRPYGQNSFARKPVLVAGVSSGKIGTAVAQSHLKQVLVYLDADVLGQPELYLGPAKEVFNENGDIATDETKDALTKALDALARRVRA
ncbi:MAG TPA: NAD(P)H-dependent oxidoreductase [Candidatus Paceibacterota bacterium]|nr:NAD(P)H-dependent oxidoreductase [Candidatus Paceibacterota bacterium]